MKTKILYVLSMLMIVNWVLLIIWSISDNESFWIWKSSAEVLFYQSTLDHGYNDPDLYNKYSSPVFPLETIYEKVKVTLTSNPTPTPVTVTVNNITVHSH